METVIFDRYASVEFCGERYGSLDSRSERSSYVIAPWVGVGGQINSDTSDAKACSCPVTTWNKIFASMVSGKPLSWPMFHGFRNNPDRHKRQSGTTEIWCKDIFEPLGAASFLPVQRIQCKFVGTVQTWKREKCSLCFTTWKKNLLVIRINLSF